MFYTQSVAKTLLDSDCTSEGLSSHEAGLRTEKIF